MSIDISMAGSGTIGEIQPGWTVNEYATPVTPGETSGGTGQVNVAVRAKDDTLFIVNNAITTTEQSLGSVSGVVKAVNQTGLSASFSHNTQLSMFDANLSIPALGAGGVVPAVDVCSQLIGRDIILNKDIGYYYSLRGHSQGFDSTGAVAGSKTWNNKVYDLLPGLGNVYYTGQIGSISGSNFFTLNNDIWAGKVYGDYLEDDFTKTSSRLAFKAMLNASTLQINYASTLNNDNDNEGAYFFTVYIDPVAKTIITSGKVVVGGMQVNLSSSVSIAGLDLTKELSIFTEFKRPSTYSGVHTFTIIACNTSNYNLSYSTGFTYNGARAYGSSWSITNSNDSIIIGQPTTASGVRGIYRAEDAGLPTAGYATVATNYILNPSFTVNTNNWTAFGTGNVTPSVTTGGWVATNCMKVTQTSAMSLPAYGMQQRYTLPVSSSLPPNNVSAYIKGPGVSVKIYVEQYNSSDILISTTYDDAYDTTSTKYSSGSWVRVSKDFYIKPGAVYIIVKLVGTGTEYYVDAVMSTVSQYPGVGFVPDYFDGDTTDNATFIYSYDTNGYSLKQASLSAINQEYENPTTYIYESLTIGGPVGSVNGNGWQYIQDACTAYAEEISLINDNILIRPVGTNSTSLDNIVGSPSIAPSMILGGRNIEMVYSQSRNAFYDSFYDAQADSNRVLSVKANETVVTTVTLNGTPSVLSQPKRRVTAPTGTMSTNQYVVSGATGTIITADQWEDYGGSLKIAISPTVPNAADVTLVGPSSDIPGNAGPYKLAYTASGTDYAALNIGGSGVLFTSNTLKLQTGTDPLKVTNDVAKTVTNPFIDTLERAYDRGIWTASLASGPTVTLSGSIPVSALSSFGITAGSLVSYRDSIYRITDCTIGNLGVNFTAVRHVTVEDFDAIWNGSTVGNFDLLWSDYQTSDNSIRPLWYEYISVLPLSTDTDGNPYYAVSGTATISVFPDTDMNPYYETGGSLPGADPVYLDTDDIPYDGGAGYGS